MNLTVNSQVFAQELRLVTQVVNAKAPLPILQNVLIVAGPTGVELHTTDLDIGLSTQCAAVVHEPGRVTLPAKRLADLMNEFPDADVTIRQEHAAVRISCGVFQSRLQTFGAQDFPTVPLPAPTSTGPTLPLDTVRSLVSRTCFATSDKNIRYFMSGAQCVFAPNVVALAATDGRRLALATATRHGEHVETFILSNKALSFLKSVEGDVEATVIVDERHVFVTFGTRRFYARLVDGSFPNYQQIIPQKNTLVSTVNRVALTAALRRVVFASDSNSTVYFSLSTGMLHLAASSAEVGEAAEHVPLTYEGRELKFGMNAQHVLDFLDVAQQTTIEIRAENETTAVLFSDGPSYVNVIMPMR